MTQHNDPIQQASDRYHAHYSDVSYKAIQRTIISDLYGQADTLEWEKQLDGRLSDEIPNRLMNTITDAASEICQWPGFEGSLTRLASEIGLQLVSYRTIRLIVDYLHQFEDRDETFSTDLQATVHATCLAYKSETVLNEAAACASEIHSWRGRAAHDLLVAAEQLVRAAQLLLNAEDDMSYIQEKIRSASDRIVSATQEGFLKKPSQ